MVDSLVKQILENKLGKKEEVIEENLKLTYEQILGLLDITEIEKIDKKTFLGYVEDYAAVRAVDEKLRKMKIRATVEEYREDNWSGIKIEFK